MVLVSSGARTTWGRGDYPRMAECLEPAARRLVDLARIDAADRVLDVACGTGNAALLAAQRGARVVGVDLEPALLDVARKRAAAAGARIGWQVADAVALPFPDGRFARVLSAFGVMYAANQAGAARELARVCEPGARLAFAAWMPDSFMPAMGAILAPYLPPPIGGAPPTRWGDEQGLDALLSPCGVTLDETRRDWLPLTFPDRDEAVEFLVRTAGHLLVERPRLLVEGRWEAALVDLDGLVRDRAHRDGGGVVVRLEYLLAVGRAGPA
jgi:SAM-dependent methyltransferase